MAARRKPVRGHFRPQKKRQQRDGDDSMGGIEMQDFFRHALTLNAAPASIFPMDSIGRARLAAAMWNGDSLQDDRSLTVANAELAGILEVLLRKCGDTSEDGEEADASEVRTAIRLEAILTNLHRVQSQKQMALVTARMSVAAARCQLHRTFWRIISLLSPGLLASRTWTEEFMQFARDYRPPCQYEELPFVGATVFDNYTRKVVYQSMVTVEKSGYLLNMTNWGSITVPKMLAPPNFDAKELCMCYACYARIVLHGLRVHTIVLYTVHAYTHACCFAVLCRREEPSETDLDGQLLR